MSFFLQNSNLNDELNLLQGRLDELRVMLRKEVADDILPAEPFQILICRTESETVGLVMANVEEVLPMCRLTGVPDAEPWFFGLLNLSGEMIPVLDLTTKITGIKPTMALSDLIVICNVHNNRAGIIIKEVVGIHQVARENVHDVSGSLTGAPYLLGTTEISNDVVLLLNVPGLSSSSAPATKEVP